MSQFFERCWNIIMHAWQHRLATGEMISNYQSLSFSQKAQMRSAAKISITVQTSILGSLAEAYQQLNDVIITMETVWFWWSLEYNIIPSP